MKSVLSLSLAAVLIGGMSTAAFAVPSENYFAVEATEVAPPAPSYVDKHPYTRCHGRASGTSDASCGTLTGGPSGGLF